MPNLVWTNIIINVIILNMKICWNWNAFIYGLLWWLYKRLYIQSTVIIIGYCFFFIIIEYISNYINSYDIVYLLIKILPYLMAHIVFGLIANNFTNKKCISRNIIKYISIIIGIIILFSSLLFISYLFDRNILNIMKGQYFEKLLLADNKNKFLKEIDNYGFILEKRNNFELYTLYYKNNKITILDTFRDKDFGTFNIIFEYDKKEYFYKEIMPIIFMGKKRNYYFNNKWKTINNRPLLISYEEGKITILSGYY